MIVELRGGPDEELQRLLVQGAWDMISWAANMHDSTQYAFHRTTEQDKEVVVSVLLTPATERLTHVNVERWTYWDSGRERAVLEDKLVEVEDTQEFTRSVLSSALADWDAPGRPNDSPAILSTIDDENPALEDRLEAPRFPEDSGQLTKVLLAELVTRQEGAVELEALGVELAQVIHAEVVADDSLSAKWNSSRTGRWMQAPELAASGLICLVGALQAVLTFEALRQELSLAAALLASVVVAITATVFTAYLGSGLADFHAGRGTVRGLRSFSITGLGSFASIATIAGLYVFLLLPLGIVWGVSASGRSLIQGPLGLTLNSYLVGVVNVATLLVAYIYTWSRREGGREIDGAARRARAQRIALLREFLARANQIRAEIRQRQLDLLQQHKDVVGGMLAETPLSELLDEPPYCRWMADVERALEDEEANGHKGLTRDRSSPLGMSKVPASRQ